MLLLVVMAIGHRCSTLFYARTSTVCTASAPVSQPIRQNQSRTGHRYQMRDLFSVSIFYIFIHIF